MGASDQRITMTDENRAMFQAFGGVELWSPSRGERVPAEQVLANKVVMLYFSAAWCGPCKKFTPLLQSFYESLRKKDDIEDFELVFCSMDSSIVEYQYYTNDMPWWCLPYQSPATSRLAAEYRADAIPSLLVLDRDGTILVQDGVEEVTKNPQCFPWRHAPLLPPQYLKNGTLEYSGQLLNGKYIMLYFGAGWCAPCNEFEGKLVQVYQNLKAIRDDFEILYVSSDRTERAFDQVISKMPFAAVPYGWKIPKLQVTCIPTVVIYGPDGTVLNRNVRHAIESNQPFPYHQPNYGDLNTVCVNINTSKCVILFHELGDDEDQERIKTSIMAAASECRDLQFYWVLSKATFSTTVRSILQLVPIGMDPVMVLLDAPHHEYYQKDTVDEISSEAILDFIAHPGDRRKL